jgi:hypothetical protein
MKELFGQNADFVSADSKGSTRVLEATARTKKIKAK